MKQQNQPPQRENCLLELLALPNTGGVFDFYTAEHPGEPTSLPAEAVVAALAVHGVKPRSNEAELGDMLRVDRLSVTADAYDRFAAVTAETIESLGTTTELEQAFSSSKDSERQPRIIGLIQKRAFGLLMHKYMTEKITVGPYSQRKISVQEHSLIGVVLAFESGAVGLAISKRAVNGLGNAVDAVARIQGPRRSSAAPPSQEELDLWAIYNCLNPDKLRSDRAGFSKDCTKLIASIISTALDAGVSQPETEEQPRVRLQGMLGGGLMASPGLRPALQVVPNEATHQVA